MSFGRHISMHNETWVDIGLSKDVTYSTFTFSLCIFSQLYLLNIPNYHISAFHHAWVAPWTTVLYAEPGKVRHEASPGKWVLWNEQETYQGRQKLWGIPNWIISSFVGETHCLQRTLLWGEFMFSHNRLWGLEGQKSRYSAFWPPSWDSNSLRQAQEMVAEPTIWING